MENTLPNHGELDTVSNHACTRRQFLLAAALLSSVGIFGTAADATMLEPRRLIVKHFEVRLRRIPARLDGFRIAQLSDLHYDPFYTAELADRAVNITNGLKPDLVVLTGDYVNAFRTHRTAAAASAELCALALSNLRSRFGTLAVLGNHDYRADPQAVARSLESRGVTVLNNQSVPFELESSRLWVAGVDDVLQGKPDLYRALQAVPRGEATVLLVHEPDYADYAAHQPVDLQLSGHSHGGQIRIPFVGPPYLPQLARKYPQGLRQVGSLALNTNCGIGTSYLHVRLNCPPEISLLTLRSGHS
jgi:uncharacterized protein